MLLIPGQTDLVRFIDAVIGRPTLITEAGQPFEYRSFPEQPHPMHQADPTLYTRTVIDWAASVLAERAEADGRADR